MTKKEKEKIILYHQMKRKRHKIKLSIISATLIFVAIILIITYLMLNKKMYIQYKEKSDVNYKVNLKPNEFYKDDYVEEGIDVISNVIKDIDVKFKYDLELSNQIEYTYKYKILAKTELKEKSKTNLIYETEKELLNKSTQIGKNNKINIIEKVNINYNEYNNQINKLVEAYKLTNTTSNLYLNFELSVIDKNTGKQINQKSNVISMEIPLNTKTVGITVKEEVRNDFGKIVIEKNQYENLEYLFVTGVLILIVGIVTLVMLIKYILDTRSAEKMYEDELRKILFDYKSYIQKIKNEIDYEEYKVIKIDTFRELIEMREEIQSPIFMYNEDDKKKTTFIMLNENLLFEYVLEANLIRKNLILKNKEKKEKNNEKNK